MKMIKSLFFIMITTTLWACSSKQMYEGMVHSQKLECNEVIQRQEYQECVDQNNRTYEEYVKAVDEVKKSKKTPI